jgi:hypothetical protein
MMNGNGAEMDVESRVGRSGRRLRRAVIAAKRFPDSSASPMMKTRKLFAFFLIFLI